MNFNLTQNVKEASFSAKVIRADGSVEDLGIIAYYSSNPLKNFIFKVKQFFKS